jgi:hypothetical protein
MNWRIIFVLVILGVFGGVVYQLASKRHLVQAPGAADSAEAAESEPAVPDPEMVASNALAQVRQWVDENPERYGEGAGRCDEVSAAHRDTAAARAAAALAATLREAQARAVAQALDELNSAVKELEEQGKGIEALALLESYAAPFSEETRELRSAAAERLRVRIAETQERRSGVFDQTLAKLLTQGVKETAAAVREQGADAENGGQSREWRQLVDTLAQAERVGETILNSFKAQVGQEVAVELKGGIQRLPVAGAEQGAFFYNARVGNARLQRRISFSELSERELEMRAGDDLAGLYLLRLTALALMREHAAAEPHLAGLPSPLRERIAEALEKSAGAGAQDDAWKQLTSVLARAGVAVQGIETDADGLTAALKSVDLSRGMKLLLHAAARDLAIQYRGSEWLSDKGVIRVINAMLGLKPEDEGVAQSDAPASGESADDAATGDAKNIDWRREIDF